MFTLPIGSRQWTFLVSTRILLPSCFVGIFQDTDWGQPRVVAMFFVFIWTMCIVRMAPFCLTMNAIGEVFDASDGSTNGLVNSTFVRYIVPRFFGASIPLFYFEMHSSASFIKYPGAGNASAVQDDLMEARSLSVYSINQSECTVQNLHALVSSIIFLVQSIRN